MCMHGHFNYLQIHVHVAASENIKYNKSHTKTVNFCNTKKRLMTDNMLTLV